MCGIFGKISPKNSPYLKDETNILTQMMYTGALRGFDSTGYFTGKSNDNLPVVYKRAIPSSDFIRSRNFQKDMKTVPYKSFFVGHNRAATKGNIDDESSHPFVHGNITLVHNGTLFQNPNGTEAFDIDSEAICYSLALCKTEEETIKVLEDINGAFALVWWDGATKQLYMTRNYERPLHIFELNDGIIFFCSEKEMGEWILGRNNKKIMNNYSLPEDELWSFKIQDKVLEINKRKYEPNIFSYYGYYNAGNNNQYQSYTRSNFKWSKQELEMLEQVGYSPDTIIQFKMECFVPYNNSNSKKDMSNYNRELGSCYTYGKSIFNGKEIKFRLSLSNRTRGFFLENSSGNKRMEGVPFSIFKDNRFDGNYTIIMNLQGIVDKEEKAPQKKLMSLVQDPKDKIVETCIIDGQYREKDEILEALSLGCVQCGKALTINDLEDIEWHSGDMPVCYKCVEDFKEYANG